MGFPPVNYVEADGSPSTYPYKVILPNASLTDNGDSTVTISFIIDAADVIKDTHIDWGTGAGQVSADDIPDGATNAIITLTQETNFETAYTHSQDNSQAHSDYMLNTTDSAAGPYSFTGTAPQLTLGSNSLGITYTGTFVLRDGQTANDVTINTTKLTTASYTAQFPDKASGTHDIAFGTITNTQVAYADTNGDLTSSKNMTFSGSMLTIGAAGTTGAIVLYSEQGATDYTMTLKPNAAMTANTTFYLPATDPPTVTQLMTMTTGGVMGFQAGTSGQVLFWSGTNTLGEDADFTFLTDTLTVTKIAATTFTSKTTYTAVAGSTTEGDLWNDSTQHTLQSFTSGIEQSLVGCIFTSTADADVAGAVEGNAETSMIGTGVGTLTLPANFFTVGKTVRVTVRGYYSTAATANTTIWKAKLGSTAVITSPTAAPSTSRTNQSWGVTFDLTCRTTGASGTIQGSGFTFASAGVSWSLGRMMDFNATSAVVVDTTASQVIDLTCTLGGTLVDVWVSTNVTVEVLN